MTNNQINELNELLKDHAETLTAFGDELLNYGMKRGSIAGCLGTYLGIGISLSAFYIAKKIKSKKSKKKSLMKRNLNMEESYKDSSFSRVKYIPFNRKKIKF